MLGLSFEKLILIILVAALIVGPQRLPLYAEKLAQLIRSIRDFTDTAKARATAELGPEFDPAEWKKLDPRHYDPRRIIQNTLADAPAQQNPSVHVEQAAEVEEVATINSDQPKSPPRIAEGGWQEALLARVATPVPQLSTQNVETGISSSETGLEAATHRDS